MKRIASILGMLALAVVALLVVPTGTANAAQRSTLNAGDAKVSLAGADYDTIRVQLTKGLFTKSGDTLNVVNALGVTTERINLTGHKVGDRVVPMNASLSADRRSVDLKPQVARTNVAKHDVAKKKRMSKAAAYDDMVRKANRNLNCALPTIGAGALIGGIIGFFVIVGAFWGIAAGAAVGAYVGYSNCRGGETIRAAQRWLNTP